MSVFSKASDGFVDHIGAFGASLAHVGAKIGAFITAIREIQAESAQLQREMYKKYGLRAD